MNKVQFEVDDSQVLKMFSEFSTDKMRKISKKVLGKGASMLVKQAKENFKGTTSKFNSTASNAKHKWHSKVNKAGQVTFKSLSDGIRYSINKSGDEAKVNIMGDFRLKWFEKGTKDRTTKKGYNRGSMTGDWFFKRAQQQKESEIFSKIESMLKESIIKESGK